MLFFLHSSGKALTLTLSPRKLKLVEGYRYPSLRRRNSLWVVEYLSGI